MFFLSLIYCLVRLVIWDCLSGNVYFVGKDRAGRTRLLLHKHLVLVTCELIGPRQEGLGLCSVVRVAGGELISVAEL